MIIDGANVTLNPVTRENTPRDMAVSDFSEICFPLPGAKDSLPGNDVREALTRAFEEQRTTLLRTAFRLVKRSDVAEDVVQDVCLKFLARAQQQVPENLGAYLQAAVLRCSIDCLRRDRNKQSMSCLPDEAVRRLNEIPAPDEQKVREDLEEIGARYARMRGSDKRALADAVLSESIELPGWMSDSALLEHDNISANAARVRLWRARKLLAND